MIADINTKDRRDWIDRGCYPETDEPTSSGWSAILIFAIAVSLPSILLAIYYGVPSCPLSP